MASCPMKRGLLITFDGPEGCGKTTQAKMLAQVLKKKGCPVVLTRDPGGAPIAEEIRGLLLNHDYPNLGPLSEMLLYETCRASLVEEVILPALRKGKIVISDRFSDATLVYQGMAGGIPESLIREIDRRVCRGLVPDITFILDVAPRVGLKRLSRQRSFDRMEGKPLRFHNAVRRGYRRLAKRNPKRIRWIPAGSAAKVREKISEEMTRVFQRHFGAACCR
ncbi:MAG: dTMP kinase [Candidatus Omnitrophota bacterium]